MNNTWTRSTSADQPVHVSVSYSARAEEAARYHMMQTPPPKPSGLQRLRRMLRFESSHDVIMANVGAGASEVIVGKNILKIGTLVVPTVPVIVTLILALIGGGTGGWLYLAPSTMPPGRFNVAIAEFSTIDAQGHERVSDDSALISKTLFTTVQAELQQLPAAIGHLSGTTA